MTHRIHVDGADECGAWFRFECTDDDDTCRINGECNIGVWFDEVGIELVTIKGLHGPPPWHVDAEWHTDDGPTLVPHNEPNAEEAP